MNNNKNRNIKSNNKTDITLMTLLAYEATKESRDLLKKYNRQDAVNKKDLEGKLADLYFSVDDKIQIEKEMAAIHPHRKWLEKYIEPKIVEKTIEVVKEIKPSESSIKEVTPLNNNYSNYCGNSYFDGQQGRMFTLEPKNNMNDYIGLIALVAVVGISYYAINKSK